MEGKSAVITSRVTARVKDCEYPSEDTRGGFIGCVERIVVSNRAWHAVRLELGAQHSASQLLRRQKSMLQVALLRDFPTQCFLLLDLSGDSEEALYSLVLSVPAILPSGQTRTDADHIPARIVTELLTDYELRQFIRKRR